MPLPDERPRQSVANLIGRFEKQKPPTGSSAPPISFPRTSSVASHRTGDSAQEEVKEKREWPPKGPDNPATVSPPIQLSEKRLSPPSMVPPTNKENPILLEPERPSPSAAAQAVSPLDQTPPSPIPVRAKSPPSSQMTPVKAKSPPPSQLKPTSTRATTSVKSPAPKPGVKAAHEASIKHQSSGGSAPSSSTPVKPQHTGQSSTSTHTATRAVTKPRASAPPKTPAMATPARSRTPMSTRPKTPSSAPRAITPSSGARPKTPSGLYAPTAASLARSKAGAPAPPPVEKPKRKVTTDLSKPTAASASRMRTAAPAAVTKSGKAPTGKPTATTKTATKTTVAKTSTLVKRPVAAKPRSGEVTATGDKDKAKTSSGAALVAGAAVVGTVAAVAAVTAAVSDDISQQDIPEAIIPDVGDAPDSEREDHPVDVQEDTLADEEHLELEEQPDSHDDEEIENYDEDFPDDSHHETTEMPENGHAAVADLDNESFVEEPLQEHATEPEGDFHHDDALSSEAGHDELEEVGEDSSQTLPESQDVNPELHHSEDIVEAEPHDTTHGEPEEVAKGPKVGSDLEDLVNLLEASPKTQRPSVESSPAGAAVSEAGEIPDEY